MKHQNYINQFYFVDDFKKKKKNTHCSVTPGSPPNWARRLDLQFSFLTSSSEPQ